MYKCLNRVHGVSCRGLFGCVCVCVLGFHQCMEVLHTWGPDIFHLAEVANGNPLTPFAYTILKVSETLLLTAEFACSLS